MTSGDSVFSNEPAEKKNTLSKIISKFCTGSRKVIVIGNYGSGNIGDESMIIALSNLLHNIGIENIFVPSKNPKLVESICGSFVKPVSIVMAPLKMIRADTIIVGGGTLFSFHAGTLVKLSLILCIFYKFLHKKLIFIGFGLSDDTPRALKPILKSLLSLADGIALRDRISDGYIKRWGIRDSVVMPDLAYGLSLPDEIDEKLCSDLSLNSGSPKVGVALSSTINKLSYEKIPPSFAKLFDDLVEELNRDIELIFLTFSPGYMGMTSDRILQLEVRRNMKHHRLVQVSPYYPPQTILGLIRRLDLLVGMRFHAKIFGHLARIPVVGIVAHDKDRAFHEETCLPCFELNDLLEREDTRRRFLKCVVALLRNH